MGHINFLVAGLIFVSVIIGIFVFKLIKKKMQEEREYISAKLLSKYNVTPLKGLTAIYEGNHKGHDIRFKYSPQTKNSPAFFEISMNTVAASKLVIKQESRFESFAKKLGITKEIQIGDSEFDDKFFIDTNDENFTRKYLDTQRIEQIKALYDIKEYSLGALSIRNNKIGIIVMMGKNRITDLNPEIFERYADFLVDLKANMPSVPGPYRDIFSKQTDNKAIIAVFSFAGILCIAGLIMFILGTINYKLIRYTLIYSSLLYAIPLLCIFWVFAFPVIKGRSDSHYLFLVLLLISLIGFGFGTTGSFIFSNGFLDTSEISAWETRIIDKFQRRADKDIKYFIEVQFWRGPGEPINIRVTRSEYENILVHDPVTVKTGEGFWGHEWLKSYRLKNIDNYLILE